MCTKLYIIDQSAADAVHNSMSLFERSKYHNPSTSCHISSHQIISPVICCFDAELYMSKNCGLRGPSLLLICRA